MVVTLVTGGTGYLGRRLVGELAKRASRGDLRVLARDPDSAKRILPDVAQVVKGDMTDPSSVEKALRGAERVIHAASLVKMWERDESLFHGVNVAGLRLLLEAAMRSGVKRVVYVSSFFALGPTEDGTVADEDTPTPPHYRPRSPYVRTKFEAEGIAREAVAKGAPLVTVYPGIIYGPGPVREANLLGNILHRFFMGDLPGLVGSGDFKWCFAYMDDVVAGILAAMEKGTPGERYILGGENRTLNEVFSMVERWTGHKSPRTIPVAAAEAAGWFYLLRARLFGTRPDITPDAADMFRHRWEYSSRRAELRLGYRVTPFEEGLRVTLEHMMRDYGVPTRLATGGK